MNSAQLRFLSTFVLLLLVVSTGIAQTSTSATRATATISGRITVEGQRPPAPFFLVANHLSYVDIVLLLAELPVVFVAKQELASWPVLGYLTRLVGNIFVDRQSRRDVPRVLAEIRRRIEIGYGVVVFPEGTSSDGSSVQPMKPALFEWAAQTEYPVHCAAIRYQTRPGSPPARDAGSPSPLSRGSPLRRARSPYPR